MAVLFTLVVIALSSSKGAISCHPSLERVTAFTRTTLPDRCGYHAANVTFACADDEVGTPVQMQGTEIAVIPPNELKCAVGNCFCRDSGTAGVW